MLASFIPLLPPIIKTKTEKVLKKLLNSFEDTKNERKFRNSTVGSKEMEHKGFEFHC